MRRYKRSARVEDLLRQEIAEIIMHRLKDPRIGFVTVTKVELSDDLRHAKIYVSVFEEDKRDAAIKALRAAAGAVKAEIGSRVRLRYMPELDFRIDHTEEHRTRMDALFNEIQKSDGRTGKPD